MLTVIFLFIYYKNQKHTTYIYPLPSYIIPTKSPTPTPTPTPTPFVYIPFDPAKCPTEGSENTVNQELTATLYNYMHGLKRTIDPVTLWEPDAYVAGTINVRDLVSATNPYLEVYASVCTKNYLIVSSMGGGSSATSIITPTTQYYPWGVNIDFNQIKNSLPFYAQKKPPIQDFYNPLSFQVSSNIPVTSAPKGAYVEVTLLNKTFPATSYQIQMNYLKDQGLTYTYIFHNNSFISAKATLDEAGQITSFQTF